MRVGPIVQALADAGVEFVVIGGWAAILNGSVHTTKDVDLCYRRAPENLRRLVKALAPFQPRLRELPPDLPFVWDAATLNNGTVFTLLTTVGPVDLLAEVDGLGDFEAVRASSIVVAAFDRQVRSLDLKGLIASKRAAGRD